MKAFNFQTLTATHNDLALLWSVLKFLISFVVQNNKLLCPFTTQLNSRPHVVYVLVELNNEQSAFVQLFSIENCLTEMRIIRLKIATYMWKRNEFTHKHDDSTISLNYFESNDVSSE